MAHCSYQPVDGDVVEDELIDYTYLHVQSECPGKIFDSDSDDDTQASSSLHVHHIHTGIWQKLT